MDVDEKLSIAESILKSEIIDVIDTISLITRLHRLKIILHDFTGIIIQYNPY